MERLQRVVSKVQMESVVCEEQLNQVEALLQMVRRGPWYRNPHCSVALQCTCSYAAGHEDAEFRQTCSAYDGDGGRLGESRSEDPPPLQRRSASEGWTPPPG